MKLKRNQLVKIIKENLPFSLIQDLPKGIFYNEVKVWLVRGHRVQVRAMGQTYWFNVDNLEVAK